MGRQGTKELSVREKEFAYLIAAAGLGSTEAARKVWRVRCEKGSKEEQKYKDLARAPRVKAEILRVKEQLKKEAEAQSIVVGTGVDVDQLRKFAFQRLKEIRDDNRIKAATRLQAVKALEKLQNPASDVNLILRWIDYSWRFAKAHCPCCHKSFPLHEIKNKHIKEFREVSNLEWNETPQTNYERRLELIKLAEKKKRPHPGQVRALKAHERHIVGLGAARAGKLGSPDMPILTTKGWKKYKDLGYSDVLFDEQGNPTRIIGFSQEWTEKDGDWYELEFDTGEKLSFHENHEFVTHQYNYRSSLHRRSEEYKTKRRKQRRTKRNNWDRSNRRKLGPTIVETKEIVRTLFARGGSHVNHAIPVVKPVKFIAQELLIDPYTLGVWLGDGCSTHGVIGIDAKDKEIIDYIPYKAVSQKIDSREKKSLFLVTRLAQFLPKLRLAGLLKNKHIPSEFFIGSIEQRLALVQGMMDTDGSIDKRGRCQFDNMNKSLVDGLAELLISLGIKVFRGTRQAKLNDRNYGTCYRLWFTTTLPVFKLKRKLERLPKLVSRKQQYHYIVAAKKVFSQRGRCIEVDSPSSLFLAGKSLIPTHNSWLMAILGLLGIMLPGVEIWILARVYDDAKSEAEYLKTFLKTLFHPYAEHVIKTYEDKKNGELHMYTRWGSILKIRSAKSKGSITGRELEMALVAEPGWVTDDIYEELRARMSSRLGRIFAFGTPKGPGGLVGRLIRTTGKDEQGRIVRWTPQERLIENGAPWNISMLIYTLSPEENPEYVKSEIAAARMELTDVEFASEFRGEIASIEGAKFPAVKEAHLRDMNPDFFSGAVFVLGIDQGPTNFGACLTAYDGSLVVPCYEFYDNSERTMKANLKYLMLHVPHWIQSLGGKMTRWMLTITDRHPQVWQIFEELKFEGLEWPTQIVERHNNNRQMGDNWRRENQEWVNNLAKELDPRGYQKLIFHHSSLPMSTDMMVAPGAVLLHDQVMECLDKTENVEKESGKTETSDKGWIVKDAWRGDHVMDAWYFTMWTILSGQLLVPEGPPEVGEAFVESQRAFEYQIARDEEEELKGYRKHQVEEHWGQEFVQESFDPKYGRDLFEKKFGRKRPPSHILGMPGFYPDES